MSILSKYICTTPFSDVNVMENRSEYVCCKDWLDVDINTDREQSGWTTPTAKDLRQSMLEGNFKKCSPTACPHLSTVLKSDVPIGPIIKREHFKPSMYSELGPKNIKFSFDSACNLACPSCRIDFIRNSEFIENRTSSILKDIEEGYSKTIETISMSGYGDPFYSTSFFNYLKTFNANKYPKLQNIHLHTNAILWNSLNWNKIKNVHKFIKTAEISIDAATEETYKVVRKGGKWNLLMKNLEFINSIPELEQITFSFVIQKQNYHEIYDFYKLIKKVVPDKQIYFLYYSIQDWGILTPEVYKTMKVWDTSHPEHTTFYKVVEKLRKLGDRNVSISY